jgi:hypothetical protein
VERSDLEELQCIQPIANLASIAELGILCHNLAEGVEHVDLSDHTIQDLRHGKRVPHESGRGRELHDYANVYICARNPMMYVRAHRHTELAVVRLSCNVFDLDEAIVTDGNAASKYTAFASSPAGLRAINAEITFLGDPRHGDQIEEWRRKREQCAEVLVPERIPPEYIVGCYVSCEQSLRIVRELDLPWSTKINRHMFFQSDE